MSQDIREWIDIARIKLSWLVWLWYQVLKEFLVVLKQECFFE
jgi:hypothetical protein